jgi:PAS domain S-box-containing protein
MHLSPKVPAELAHFRALLESALLGALHISADGEIQWVNSIFAQMLGYRPEELIGRSNYDFVHEDDMALSRDRISVLANSLVPVSDADRRYRHKDGHYLWLNITASVIRDAQGKPLSILGIFHDITERKGQDILVRESEARLDAVLSGLQDVICSFSADKRELLYMNESATQALYGRSTAEFYENRQLWTDVVHPDHREVACLFWKKLDEEGIFDEIYRILRPDGAIRWVHDRAWVTRGADGKPLRFEESIRDVTESKELQRTLEAQRGKMTAASKMSALGEMAGGLAHEINNPLAIIQGNSLVLQELARKASLDKEVVEKIAITIGQTTDRISKITRSLRWFARDGERDPIEEITVKRIIEETAEFCRERFSTHGIEFYIEAVNPELKIECQPVQISQVLLNLLNNAHDAVEKSEIKWIRISVCELGKNVQLRVTDSGAGIDPDTLEKIFQPFFTTKEIGRGIGLGLSVATGIMESHFGSLAVDSTDSNTCFVATIPKKQPAPNKND